MLVLIYSIIGLILVLGFYVGIDFYNDYNKSLDQNEDILLSDPGDEVDSIKSEKDRI